MNSFKGLITYKEEYILFDPSVSSTIDKQDVARTVSHQLAHQWFGDLVTCDSFDDIWLNAGFAEFCEYIYGTPEVSIYA